MAERLTITIDGDSSGLEKSLKSAENRLNSFNQRVTNSSRNLTRLMSSMQATNSSFTTLIAAANNAASSLTRAASAANRFSNNTQSISAANARAGQSVGSLNVSFRGLILTLFSVRTAVFSIQSAYSSLVAPVIEINAAYEKQQVLLKNLSSASTELGKIQSARKDTKFIWDISSKAPFDMDSLQDTFIKLKVNGVDPTNGSMQTLLDTVAAFGGTSNNLKLATLGISQMASKGVVSMQELRQQLGEQVPTAIKAMATGLGYLDGINDNNTKKLREFFKLVETGSLSSAKAIPAMMKVLEKEYAGSAEKMMNTWDGQMARLKLEFDKMIIKITESSGDNSLFVTMKKQVNDLTTFLASADGHQFFKDMQDALAKLVNVIAESIKFVYRYREEITFLAKAIVGLFVINRVASMFSLANSVWSTSIGFLTKLKNVKDGLQLVALLFGKNVAKAAASLGIFNSSLQISLRVLGIYAGVLTAVVGTVWLYKKATDATGQVSKQTNMELDNSKKAYEALKHAIDTTVIASEEDRKAAVASMQAHRDAAREKVRHAQASIILARANANIAIAEARAKANQSATPTASYIKSGANKYLHPLVGAAITGVNSLVAPILNRDTDKRKNDALAEYNAKLEGYNTDKKALEEAEAALKNFSESPLPSFGGGADDGGDGKKKRDPLGDLDGSRSQLVSLMMQQKEMQYTIAGNKEVYEDNAEAIELAVRAEVQAIKSQKELNDRIIATRGSLPGLRAEVKEYNKELRLQEKLQNQLEQLHQTAEDQTLQAADAMGQLNDGYNSIANSVQRYINKLREQNKELLDPSINKDGIKRLTAEKEIQIAAREKAIELIAEQAKMAKNASEEIEESLLSEDELRERNYLKEMDRINQLVIETRKINGPEAQKSLDEFFQYQQRLTRRFQTAKSPMAQWALDARDIQSSMGQSLTGSMDGFLDSLSQGKLAFKDFAKSLLADLAKVIIRALIAKAILGALGMGGAPALNISTDTGPITGLDNGGLMNFTPKYHTGGIVGSMGSMGSSVDASMFKFAKRYHNGGFPGLEDNEVPIIAEKGEGVFTKEQMKALGSAGGSAPPVEVNIINQTGVQADAQAGQPRFDGEKYVIDVVMKNMNKPGPLRDSMKGMK